ncbi:MAG TPA: dihydrofolate reductase family protein [Baekduia sp.]|nr:dihydrofolate reductase family protein [Baekduia sp.]
MARLISSSLASLDGYVADEQGRFDWCAPDEEVHAFVNDLERPIGTYLYGRRMYEVMRFWETVEPGPDEAPAFGDYARIWRAADKVVFSRTLKAVDTARTRLERELRPDDLRAMKAAADRDLSIGGAELAGQALAAGLVDELHLILAPVVVGGGTRALPDGARLDLELVSERRFAGGMVHLHHRIRR